MKDIQKYICQISGLSGLGLLNLRFETDGNALWIPKESPFLADSNWLKSNFDHDKPRRINSLIIEGMNIIIRISLICLNFIYNINYTNDTNAHFYYRHWAK